jgi:hypothetical protein
LETAGWWSTTTYSHSLPRKPNNTTKPQTAGHTSRFARLVNNAPDLLWCVHIHTCVCVLTQQQDIIILLTWMWLHVFGIIISLPPWPPPPLSPPSPLPPSLSALSLPHSPYLLKLWKPVEWNHPGRPQTPLLGDPLASRSTDSDGSPTAEPRTQQQRHTR